MGRASKIESIMRALRKVEELEHFVRFEAQSFDTDVFTPETFAEEAGPLLNSWGLTQLPKMQVDADRAKKIASCILARDLAYDTPFMTESQADELAVLICSLIPSAGCFLTNANFHENPFRLSGWSPCKSATFDTGIVGFDKNFVLMLWAEAED